MAVPKTKVSKSRRDTRNSANYKLTAANLVECPHCKEQKAPHIVCKKCGYYNGKEVIAPKKEKKDKK